MASADNLKITVHGRQTHGAMHGPGVDSIVMRRRSCWPADGGEPRDRLTREPAVVSIGTIKAACARNIPDEVEMRGTIEPSTRRCATASTNA